MAPLALNCQFSVFPFSHHHLSFMCSLCSVCLSSGCETQVSLISLKKKNLHKAFTCVIDLNEVGEREDRAKFYILGIKRISNQKSAISVLKSPKVTLQLGIWLLIPHSAPATHHLSSFFSLLISLLSSGSSLHSCSCQMQSSLANPLLCHFLLILALGWGSHFIPPCLLAGNFLCDIYILTGQPHPKKWSTFESKSWRY